MSGGRIFTFYSYKGGSGRTMALANVAWILASNGKRVLTVDWDLEAPGLHRYFAPFLADAEMRETDGLIDLFYRYLMAATSEAPEGASGGDWYKRYASVADYAEPLAWRFPGEGRIDIVGAGRQDCSYSKRVNAFDWGGFYDRFGGAAVITALAESMRADYDYVLIDSRTGVSDTAGICTVQLPDALVVFFTANTQSIRGTVTVAADAFEQRSRSMRVLPVLTRVDPFEMDKLEATRAFARQEFGALLKAQSIRQEDYWPEVETPYIPYYAYEEILATFRDQKGEKHTLLEAAEGLTCWLTDDKMALVPEAEADRARVLAQFKRAVPEVDSSRKIPRNAILICHSREDRKWLDELLVILNPHLNDGSVDVLCDADIAPGQEWERELTHRLSRARAVVFLVSPEFLASEFVWRSAVLDHVAQAQSGGLSVLWIPVSYSLYEHTRIARFQALHDPARPLTMLGTASRNQALVAISRRIVASIDPSSAPSLQSVGETRDRPDAREPIVSIGHLPAAGELLLGRERELDRMDAAWENPHEHVLSIVGRGGEGKSSLVVHWLNRMAAVGWRGAERVFGWSFYSQGTAAKSASADEFMEHALRFFGETETTHASAHERGERLAMLIGSRKNLLLLDGLEPLQFPPGPLEGRLKDPALQSMIVALCAQNRGLCVITSRIALPELEAARTNVAPQIMLAPLSDRCGAELLSELGVKGSLEEREAVAQRLQGHALSILLIGSYLDEVWRGDVKRDREVVLLDQDRESGGVASRILESLEAWLSGKTLASTDLSSIQRGESEKVGQRMLGVLRLLGLFNRPVEIELFDALREQAPIVGLTDVLVGISKADWNRTLSRLRKLRIVSGIDVLDVHPLVREYFARETQEKFSEGALEAHNRLFQHLIGPPEYPDDLVSMKPLRDAIEHGCKAGRYEEALDVYRRRIQREPKAYASRALGAIGSTLAALSSFFVEPWRRVVPELSETDRAYLLCEAAALLRAMGRTEETEEALEASAQVFRSAESWMSLSATLRDLSEIALLQGNVSVAARRVAESLEFAANTVSEKAKSCATFGDILHAAGLREGASRAFEEVHSLCGVSNQQPLPLDLAEYRFCELLLSDWEQPANYLIESARRRAEDALHEATKEHGLVAMALHELTVARTWLLQRTEDGQLAAPHRAQQYVEKSLARLRQAETLEWLPAALLCRAAMWRTISPENCLSPAETDLREAEQVAQRGTMLRWQIEIALERTRLYAVARPDQFREQLAEVRRLVKTTERPYTPHVSEAKEWEPPQFMRDLHNGDVVRYERALRAADEIETLFERGSSQG